MRSAARLFLTACLCAAAAAASAADLKLDARLIWGTNDEKGGPNCKPADTGLASKLSGMPFKWKHYFEITNQSTSIPLNQTRDLKMSAHCTLRIKNLGGSRVEINCLGEGKPVDKRVDTLTPPKWLVWGGNSTNNTAWFIGLRANDPDTNKAISKN